MKTLLEMQRKGLEMSYGKNGTTIIVRKHGRILVY
jgi:hypothetical protein